jgi:hypothetical protein
MFGVRYPSKPAGAPLSHRSGVEDGNAPVPWYCACWEVRSTERPQACPKPWQATFSGVVKISPRFVVGGVAGMRVAIGAAFALAPVRLSGTPDGMPVDSLMTRSFAVRELVLGVGGLLAVTRSDASAVRVWAGLGALTDGGDVVASLAGAAPGRERSARVAALVAATGLAVELWAFARSRGGSSVPSIPR